MSQAQLIRIIELEKQAKALNERVFRLEVAIQNTDPQLIASTVARQLLDSQNFTSKVRSVK